jgi:serine/threonine-protein kinase
MTESWVVGRQIDRYELLSPIGEGGMASVWAARQRGKHGFERVVALKSILPRYASDAGFRRMLLDEARIASRIDHPNVSHIYDVGETGELLYLVLEYIDGEPLQNLFEVAQAEGGIPLPLVLRIAEETCAGLHAAHELRGDDGSLLGVVHRDVSPQNVLVSVQGAVKIIDFGIALAADRLSEETGQGALKGKVNYMSPEQARGEPLDRQADVFAAGALLFKLLTGRAPFQQASEAATLASLLGHVSPPQLPPTVPALIAEVIRKAIALKKSDRFRDARELQVSLERARKQLGIEAAADALGAFVLARLSMRTRTRRADLRQLLATSRASMADSSSSGRSSVKEPSVPEVSLSAIGGTLEPSATGLGPAPAPVKARIPEPTRIPESRKEPVSFGDLEAAPPPGNHAMGPTPHEPSGAGKNPTGGGRRGFFGRERRPQRAPAGRSQRRRAAHRACANAKEQDAQGQGQAESNPRLWPAGRRGRFGRRGALRGAADRAAAGHRRRRRLRRSAHHRTGDPRPARRHAAGRQRGDPQHAVSDGQARRAGRRLVR